MQPFGSLVLRNSGVVVLFVAGFSFHITQFWLSISGMTTGSKYCFPSLINVYFHSIIFFFFVSFFYH